MKANGQGAAAAAKKQVAKKSPQSTAIEFIQHSINQIKMALPKHVTAERLARIAMTAIRQTPELATCSTVSLMGSIMQAAQLGLEPNTPLGLAYLIPYKGEVSFQLGYKGLLQLAHNTREYKSIYAMEVRDGDEFRYCYGLAPDLVHVPDPSNSGDVVAYYAVYQTVNGGADFRVWSRKKVEDHAKRFSQSYRRGSGPWATDFDSMAKKTVLIDLLKYAPKSVELAAGVAAEGTIQRMRTDDPDLVIDAEYVSGDQLEEPKAAAQDSPKTEEKPAKSSENQAKTAENDSELF